MNYRGLWESFVHAARGVAYALRHEQSFRIQLGLSACVIILMLGFPLRRSEIIVLLLLILFVLTLELLNTALETFLDIMKPRLHFQVGVVKDIMAAMVLLASFGALVIGSIIFWPYVSTFLFSVSG